MKLAIAGIALLGYCGQCVAQSGTESERARMRENGSRVPCVDPIEQRKLEEGLRVLAQGHGSDALRILLPALTPTGERPQLEWGERETRDFFALLETMLTEATETTRTEFAASLEEDARKHFEDARATGNGRSARLRAILRAYPGTRASLEARRMLVDLAIERGDVLAASLEVDALPADERPSRAKAIEELLTPSRAAAPWPHAHGLPSGRAGQGAAVNEAPKPLMARSVPRLLGSWSVPATTWDPARGAGVVGRLERGHACALFQDPRHLLVMVDLPGAPRYETVDLRSATGLASEPTRRPAPSIAGARAFVVHGGFLGSAVLPGPGGSVPVAELFAFDIGTDATKLAWRRSPGSLTKVGDEASFLPVTCTAFDRVYALVETKDDRLTRTVHACALDLDGNLLWMRELARGVTLTADLLMHRQEAVRAGRIEAAAPVVDNGRLFVETGLGISACLDATSGTMLWSFRTARIGKLRGRESAWDEGNLVVRKPGQGASSELWLTPSDGMHAYRLAVAPGSNGILVSMPEPRGTRTLLLGIAEARHAAYWWTRTLLESGPQREALDVLEGRERHYDAPPLDRGDALAAPPLLTDEALVFATGRMLAWLDLEKDLYYERVFELSAIGRAGFGPVLPWRDGVVFACDLGPLFWAP
ncbi:MAG: PQQ-binding-like beta-propeller repeat protein [Planctomycetes bacterium]|nr:PQQ-binding-like beta-propeller repeat protein [Planctomycetota bacterium]MCB9892088.1 PQQ-binding-like beta-propeller repeat protein [Planctomycetota bacterium]MCB9920340.1 PQQ-binding-like beta-propeller repeat protein [Planctomycetota bacterium]